MLDFGLAKALSTDSAAAADPAASPTLTMRATMAGVIMGTAGYMSPEQARGQAVDKRADIWSFGIVVYELLTGRQLFESPTISDTLAAVLTREPDLTTVPPRFHRLLRLCLARDPRQRLRDISGVRLLLDESAPAPPAVPTRQRALPPWAVAAVAGLAALSSAGLWLRRPAPESATVRFEIPPPRGAEFGVSNLAVSPDGRRIAFTADKEKAGLVWVRELNASEARPLAGTEGVNVGGAVFWSPDSRHLAFFSAGKLKKIDIDGGPATTICDAPDPRGGSWNRDNVILFNQHSGRGLMRVSASGGGNPSPVTELNSAAGENSHRWPWFLPDGRHFLYLNRASPETSAIWVGDLESKTRQRIVPAYSNAAYDPRGFLVFLREGALTALPWNACSLAPTGEAISLGEEVLFTPNNSQGYYSISGTGVLAYFAGGSAGSQRVTWFDRSGKNLGGIGPPGMVSKVAVSPDGSAAAISRTDAQNLGTNVWLHNLEHDTDSKFTFETGLDATWSPDNTRIAFSSVRNGKWAVYAKPSSGAGKEERLFEWPYHPYLNDWSRDGKFLIFSSQTPENRSDIFVAPVAASAADRKPDAFISTSADERQGRLSPDGKWLVYTSDEGHGNQVYVQSFPGKEGKYQISPNGGAQPCWRPDGKELFYISSRTMMAVDVKTGSKFEFGAPKPLFGIRVVSTSAWDIAPDGKRFLIPAYLSDEVNNPIQAVLNWQAVKR